MFEKSNDSQIGGKNKKSSILNLSSISMTWGKPQCFTTSIVEPLGLQKHIRLVSDCLG